MVDHTQVQSHQYHYFQNREIDELYISIALRTFAVALIAIFVPVYLINLGFSLGTVFLYFIIYYATATAIMPYAMLFNTFGIKKNMAFGSLFLIVYYLFLTNIGSIHFSIVAILGGLSSASYFAGYHIEFSHFHTKGSEGKQSSIIYVSTVLAASLGPIIGGLLIDKFTYSVVFFVASVVMVCSLIPLFMSKDYKMRSSTVDYGKILRSDKLSKGFAYIASGSTLVVAGIAWPLFIYTQLSSVVSLGVIISMTSLLLCVFSFYMGKIIDGSFGRVFKLGIWTYSLSWFFRFLLISPVGLFIANTYASFSGTLIELSMAKMIYLRRKNLMNYFLFREIYLFIGRIGVLIIAYFVLDFVVLFILAFLCTQLYWFLEVKQKK